MSKEKQKGILNNLVNIPKLLRAKKIITNNNEKKSEIIKEWLLHLVTQLLKNAC